MNILFFLSFIFIALSLPFIILIFALYFISTRFKVSFKISNWYQLSNIIFEYENEIFKLAVKIGKFELRLIWLRIRFIVSEVNSIFVLKKDLIKSSMFRKAESVVGENKNEVNQLDSVMNKDKFSETLRELFKVSNRKANKLLTRGEIENVDNVLTSHHQTFIDRVLKICVTYFDIILEQVNAFVVIEGNCFYYGLNVRKVIVGMVRGLEKKKEIDLIAGVYDLNVKEFRTEEGNRTRRDKKLSRRTTSIVADEYFSPSEKSWEERTLPENECYVYNLLALSECAVKVKFDNGFFPANSSLALANTISVSFESSKARVNMSTLSLKYIFKFTVDIIKTTKMLEQKQMQRAHNLQAQSHSQSNYSNNLSAVKTTSIEEFILDCITGKVKKIELRVTDIEANISSDNFLLKYMVISAQGFNFKLQNYFFDGCDNRKNMKILSSQIELALADLAICQWKESSRKVIITEIPIFAMKIKDEIVYNYEHRRAEISSTLSSSFSDIDIAMTTKDLDKVLEIVMVIVDGIDSIELHSKISFVNTFPDKSKPKTKIVEEYTDTTLIDFNFSNISASLYNDKLMTQVNEISLKLLINKNKFGSDEININFSPINLSVTHDENNKIINNYYVSNVLLKDFKIRIKEDKNLSDIEIIFGDTFVSLYDHHLILIIQFVSEFISSILENAIRKKYQRNKLPTKRKKKDRVKLQWDNVEMINYLDKDDMIYGELKDMVLVVDDYMEIPNVKFYHHSPVSTILRNLTPLVELNYFQIKFSMCEEKREDSINIVMDDIKINFYSPELALPIMKVSTFYTFFPEWIDFYFIRRFLIDQDTYLEKYIIENVKKSITVITFNTISIGINDSAISPSAIMQAELSELESAQSKSDAEVIKYLKDIKRNLFTLIITNFVINVDHFKEVITTGALGEECDMINSEQLTYYYKSICVKADIDLNFAEIQLFLECHKLIGLKDFHILVHDENVYDSFDTEKIVCTAMLYKNNWLLYHKVLSQQAFESRVYILIDNLKFNFEDVKMFDKTLSFAFKAVKVVANLPFSQYDVKSLSDKKMTKLYRFLNVNLHNLDGSITSIDPNTKQAYNKLDIKLAILALSQEESQVFNEKKCNILELSVHYFIFSFDPSQKSGFPLIIVPLAEANFDNLNDIIRISIPTEITNKSSYSRLFADIYKSELHAFIMETRSLTMFINFKYLSTFVKIFEVFWEKSKNLRANFIKKSKEPKIGETSTAITHMRNNPASQTCPSLFSSRKKEGQVQNRNMSVVNEINQPLKKNSKLMLSLFDLKIIYLLEYKNEYDSTFKFHKFVRDQLYFGYIIRLYSFSLKQHVESYVESLQFSSNLFTVSFLAEENFSDETFFLHDREIQTTKFQNLKEIDQFNKFMELDKSNSRKLINKNLLTYFEMYSNLEVDSKEIFKDTLSAYSMYNTISTISLFNSNSNMGIIDYTKLNDLKFDYKHTLVKVSNVNFEKMSKIDQQRSEEIHLLVENLKFSWNNFNKDVLSLLLFEDVLLIVDKIILKIDDKKKSRNEDIKQISASSVTIPQKSSKKQQNIQYNFIFVLKNPQIVIQNEIKKSTLLLTNKKPCKVISKILVVGNLKDFSLEVNCDMLSLYSAPKCIDSDYIHWIGNTNDNNYYLDESLFGQILETPKIRFQINQKVESREHDEFEVFTNMNIYVDKIRADFESSYFTDFMNIIEVFLFDRGYSFAEQKNDIDSKKKDLENYDIADLEHSIKTTLPIKTKKQLQKEISFSLGEVKLNLCKEGKTLMEFFLINFEGLHQIFSDKSSESQLNVRNLHIRNAESSRNEIILTPLYSDRQGNFEDTINIVTFRKRDSYLSIGTDSQWYTLDYFELNFRPIAISISKTQIEFIINFFFQDQTPPNEDEQIKLIMSSNRAKNEKEKKKGEIEKKAEKKEEYPIYFKHFKFNETEIVLNFEYGEHSLLNIPRTKLKFGAFEKQEKFYPLNAMLDRFVSHCKQQCVKNIYNIMSGLFSTGGPVDLEKKKKDDDEESHRKLLFGSK